MTLCAIVNIGNKFLPSVGTNMTSFNTPPSHKILTNILILMSPIPIAHFVCPTISWISHTPCKISVKLKNHERWSNSGATKHLYLHTMLLHSLNKYVHLSWMLTIVVMNQCSLLPLTFILVMSLLHLPRTFLTFMKWHLCWIVDSFGLVVVLNIPNVDALFSHSFRIMFVSWA